MTNTNLPPENLAKQTIPKETLTNGLKQKSRSKWVANFAKTQILKRLQHLKTGTLIIIDGEEEYTFGYSDGIAAIIHVQDARFYGEIAFGGSIGAGEAYMLGYWTADNLTNVIRLMCVNQSVMDALEGGYQWATKPLFKILHWLNSNTTEGSRKNIAAHYDLGNDFFKLWLDPTMMYSSGIFEHANIDNPSSSLEAASLKKLKVICDKLDLKTTDHLVEIGTGWGGFAIYAAKYYGCKVTTTTISKQQYALP